MTELFIDTSGWANLIDISQPYHDLAVQISCYISKSRIIKIAKKGE